jgi:hypothetical protein
MEIVLTLLAVILFGIGYAFYRKNNGAVRRTEEAVIEPKVVAEVKPNPVDRKVLRSDINERYENTLRSLDDDIAEVKKTEKSAAPKIKTTKKATSKKSDAVEEASPVVKKPKIKIVK